MLSFGGISLRHGLLLAPLAGYTDAAFRAICRLHGAEYQVTEMVSSRALCYHDKKTPRLARVGEEELPCAVQIFGSEPAYMAEAAAMVEKGMAGGAAPSAIDINMGCPVKKIVSAGDGSALLKNPSLAYDIVKAVKGAVSLPVTVKIRVGYTEKEKGKGIPEFAKALEEAGASLITVHGRTREAMYSGQVDLASIAAVKAAVSVPVVGNGDIASAEDALRMLRETGCDGLMIGRGAVGNPFVFEEIAAALEGRDYTPPTVEERLSLALLHLSLLEKEAERALATGESAPPFAAEARKQIAAYTKGMREGAALRAALCRAASLAEMTAIIRQASES